MAEYDLLQQLMLRATGLGARLFRNNTGLGWIGRSRRNADGSVTIFDPRPLHAGLCKGSSDLIGWTPITITPDMVGKTLAVFTAAEAKTGKGRATIEQAVFVSAVRSAGGIAGVVHSEDDLRMLLMKRPPQG